MTEHEKRIREALEAGPTEGPWAYADNPYGHDAIYGAGGRLIAHVFGDDAQAQQDACLIAACNPTALRALLADLDAMRGALGGATRELEGVLASINDDRIHHDGDDFHERLQAARAALKGASHE